MCPSFLSSFLSLVVLLILPSGWGAGCGVWWCFGGRDARRDNVRPVKQYPAPVDACVYSLPEAAHLSAPWTALRMHAYVHPHGAVAPHRSISALVCFVCCCCCCTQELLVLVRQEGVLHGQGPQRGHARRPQVRTLVPGHGQVCGVWVCGRKGGCGAQVSCRRQLLSGVQALYCLVFLVPTLVRSR